MKLSLLFEDIPVAAKAAQERIFPIKHGPFKGKGDIYDWMKRIRGDKGHKGSLYYGKGPQSNILKGGGGGQEAWTHALSANTLRNSLRGHHPKIGARSIKDHTIQILDAHNAGLNKKKKTNVLRPLSGLLPWPPHFRNLYHPISSLTRQHELSLP